MGSEKWLYAGLLAISVGCGEDEERIAREKEYCENRLADVTRVLTLTNSTPNIHFDWSDELRQRLSSKNWCTVQGSYRQDGTDLAVLANGGASDYCSTLGSEANKLIATHEKEVIFFMFKRIAKCDGDSYTTLLSQAQKLQRVIDSYQQDSSKQ